ncbi:thiol:disulfide interchange protein DsbA/DsbL [Kitasatospora sp. NPDC052896]|uniref:thiol:disulfide interchange protein DsbA/DsbL n=1 Tax=Kitasatospora sp. NPDC052896 TaxID=3364061 RepID=UPI0037C60C0A
MQTVSRTAVLLLATALTLGPAVPTAAAAAQHSTGSAPVVAREGEQYVSLKHPQPVHGASVREVVEIFWYGCRHSAQLEQPLEAWAARQPHDVVLRRIPAVWPGTSDQTVERGHARLFYTLDRLGEVDRLQSAVFRAVREDGLDLTTEDPAAGWAAEHGIDEQRFRSAYESSQVRDETDHAPDEMTRYEVTELPTAVVQGRYQTSATRAGGVTGIPAILDQLLQKTGH